MPRRRKHTRTPSRTIKVERREKEKKKKDTRENDAVNTFESSLSPIPCLCENCRSKAVVRQRVDSLLNILTPTIASERRRKSVVRWLRDELLTTPNGEDVVVAVGSYSLKTYLPNGDIDLIVVTNRKRTWCGSLCERVCDAGVRGRSGSRDADDGGKTGRHTIRTAEFVNGDSVRLVRLFVDNLHVDLASYDDASSSVDAAAYFESYARRLGKNDLFKRSVLLIKAWCTYDATASSPSESGGKSSTSSAPFNHFARGGGDSRGVMGARYGGLCTHALNTMIVHLLETFGEYCDHPLDVLAHFLSYYASFSWESTCVTVDGALPLSAALPKGERRAINVLDPIVRRDDGDGNAARKNCAKAMRPQGASQLVGALRRGWKDLMKVVKFGPCDAGGGSFSSGSKGDSGERPRGKKRSTGLDVSKKLRVVDDLFRNTWSAFTSTTVGEGGMPRIVPWRPDLCTHPMQRWSGITRPGEERSVDLTSDRAESGPKALTKAIEAMRTTSRAATTSSTDKDDVNGPGRVIDSVVTANDATTTSTTVTRYRCAVLALILALVLVACRVHERVDTTRTTVTSSCTSVDSTLSPSVVETNAKRPLRHDEIDERDTRCAVEMARVARLESELRRWTEGLTSLIVWLPATAKPTRTTDIASDANENVVEEPDVILELRHDASQGESADDVWDDSDTRFLHVARSDERWFTGSHAMPVSVRSVPPAPSKGNERPTLKRVVLGDPLALRGPSLVDEAWLASSSKYQWYRNGLILAGATERNYVVEVVRERHLGTYVCEITSPIGERRWGEIVVMGGDAA